MFLEWWICSSPFFDTCIWLVQLTPKVQYNELQPPCLRPVNILFSLNHTIVSFNCSMCKCKRAFCLKFTEVILRGILDIHANRILRDMLDCLSKGKMPKTAFQQIQHSFNIDSNINEKLIFDVNVQNEKRMILFIVCI